MSRARDLADLSNVINKGANLPPNLIINGDMSVSQRGTSETSITTTQYANAPDRWNLAITTLGTWTASQSTTAPDGFSTSYKLECTTADASPAAGDYFLFQQRIEGQNLQVLGSGSANAKKHTLSFWVRSSKTGTYNCEITHIAGSVYNDIQYTINTADTWERKTLTFDGYQTTAIANDNTSGYFVTWWLGGGSNYTTGTHNSNTWHSTNANRAVGNVNLADSTSNEWYLTGVSLVVGDTAPVTHPYESYADNLERCQRYYEKIARGASHPTIIGGGMWYTSSNPYVGCKFKVTKRTTPTVSNGTSSNGYTWFVGGSARYSSAISFSRQTPYSVRCTQSGGLSGSGGTTPAATHGCWFELGGTDASIDVDAEL